MKFLVLIFITLIITACKVELVGDYFSQIYTKDGYAKTLQVVKEDPIEVTEPVNVTLESLNGYICVSEEQFAKYRRAYEKENKTTVLETIELKFKESRWLDQSEKNSQ